MNKLKYKTMNIEENDHAAIDNNRRRLSYHLGEQFSLAAVVMEGQKLLDEKIKREYEAGK